MTVGIGRRNTDVNDVLWSLGGNHKKYNNGNTLIDVKMREISHKHGLWWSTSNWISQWKRSDSKLEEQTTSEQTRSDLVEVES